VQERRTKLLDCLAAQSRVLPSGKLNLAFWK
jgi:hypothetical protein